MAGFTIELHKVLFLLSTFIVFSFSCFASSDSLVPRATTPGPVVGIDSAAFFQTALNDQDPLGFFPRIKEAAKTMNAYQNVQKIISELVILNFVKEDLINFLTESFAQRNRNGALKSTTTCGVNDYRGLQKPENYCQSPKMQEVVDARNQFLILKDITCHFGGDIFIPSRDEVPVDMPADLFVKQCKPGRSDIVKFNNELSAKIDFFINSMFGMLQELEANDIYDIQQFCMYCHKVSTSFDCVGEKYNFLFESYAVSKSQRVTPEPVHPTPGPESTTSEPRDIDPKGEL